MVGGDLAQFAGQKYLNLETYRKTGAPVRTPVWFAEESGTLYVSSLAEAGKVKRIRNNSLVRVMPCGIGGAPKGTWVDAEAALADAEQAEHGHKLLNQKYWTRRIGDFFSRLRKGGRVVIMIRPRAAAGKG